MNPLAIKNAKTTSQTTSFPKPPQAALIVSVRVEIAIVKEIIEIAPMGRGLRIIANIVETKRARRRQPSGVTPTGTGRIQIIKPMKMQKRNLTGYRLR
jgi:hypothetical protein